ncbi:MAG: KOW domain-containing RNA-binding protein [Oscillospiraceae bacterium]|jgi:ribosomal protein L14E/L6E/L27E|nr:KOW domain-containing RNA-binding protein [Oscillospiraceae bacterium]MBQ1620732.1 KOW domain-containing RNA-binding protein [Oscillospiraceae bacterium]MBQ1742099.1 KOW domain-containing RNA-binding protein [Oscillospiraceae bacterium]MBQ1804592.1 KOW domain-containing RNA-binding protein [Oscillospiraceae bacterium]MBQ1834540.1 KOW domain-containing RNA-binding protein [Oscillospiraceae bacterium]
MDIAKADLVEAIAGREKGKPFFVLDTQGEYLLLADGKSRRLETPKRKKQKHVRLLPQFDCRVADKIRSNEKITNSELRKALAVIGGKSNPDQEE